MASISACAVGSLSAIGRLCAAAIIMSAAILVMTAPTGTSSSVAPRRASAIASAISATCRSRAIIEFFDFPPRDEATHGQCYIDRAAAPNRESGREPHEALQWTQDLDGRKTVKTK